MFDRNAAYIDDENNTVEAVKRFGQAPVAATTSGLVAGTKVATRRGWCKVEDLEPGQQVLTFDGGLKELRQVRRARLWSGPGQCPRSYWPLELAPGCIGNTAPVQVMPGQPIMLESDIAEVMLGDPFALIPARALEKHENHDRVCPQNSMQVVQLEFDEDQIVFTKNGAMMLCPKIPDLVGDLASEAGRKGASGYSVLSGEMADLVVRAMACAGMTAHMQQAA